MIVAEVGLNHLGSVTKLINFINVINKSNVDAITFQIIKKDFFIKNGLTKYYINKTKLLNTIFKYTKKKVGLVVDEGDSDLEKFKKKIFFFKVLGSQAHNLFLINSLLKISKNIYISNKNITKKTNSNLLNFIKKNKFVKLIHTQHRTEEKYSKLQEITLSSKITGESTSFGLHCHNKNIILLSIFYNPESIFFYIKDNDDKDYPDDLWAIKLGAVENLVNDINWFKNNAKLVLKI